MASRSPAPSSAARLASSCRTCIASSHAGAAEAQAPHLGRSFRVLHLHQDGVGNQDPTINFSENIRTAKSDEIVERTGVGNDDHASGYPVFVGSNRSNVVMSLSRSSTV